MVKYNILEDPKDGTIPPKEAKEGHLVTLLVI
jgi:hypothetical protein